METILEYHTLHVAYATQYTQVFICKKKKKKNRK